MADPLRVAFIGAGANTTLRHLPGLLAIDGVEAVAVCNRSAESGQRVADEFGIARVETDPAAIFAAEDVDAVCIGTWPYRHREYTVHALEAGKHVLCEARMAMNATEAREMLAASQARPDLVAQIVPAPMDLEVWRTVRRIVGEGTLGAIREVHCDVLNGSAISPDGPLHWRHQREFSGSNVMMFGIFTEIVTRWLGPTERVLADGEIFVGSRPDAASGNRVDVDVRTASACWAASRAARASPTGLARSPTTARRRRSPSTGRRRHCTGMAPTTSHCRVSAGESETVAPDPGTAIGWNVEQDFVDSIRDGKPVELTNFEDGVHYMRLTEAVERSRTEGRAVGLDEV